MSATAAFGPSREQHFRKVCVRRRSRCNRLLTCRWNSVWNQGQEWFWLRVEGCEGCGVKDLRVRVEDVRLRVEDVKLENGGFEGAGWLIVRCWSAAGGVK